MNDLRIWKNLQKKCVYQPSKHKSFLYTKSNMEYFLPESFVPKKNDWTGRRFQRYKAKVEGRVFNLLYVWTSKRIVVSVYIKGIGRGWVMTPVANSLDKATIPFIQKWLSSPTHIHINPDNILASCWEVEDPIYFEELMMKIMLTG